MDVYGAPTVEAARGVAAEELTYMAELCQDHDQNTLLAVQRELTADGVKESYSAIEAQAAELDLVAVHGDLE